MARFYEGSTQWGYGHNTYCETFTEFCERCGWQGASALDAWQRNQARAESIARPGLAVYFAGSTDNGGYGHTGVVDDDPDYFWSVTFNGVQRYSIAWWNANSAALLGFINYGGN